MERITSPKHVSPWRRRLIRGGIALIAVLIVLRLIAPFAVGWFIGHKLQSELATRMKARLEYDRVRYQFPYGVRVDRAHLVMPGTANGPDSWVDVGRLELTLARLPIGSGPLQIQRLEIENPTVRLASTFSAPTDDSTSPTPAAAPPNPSAPPQKLSDLFELKNVTLTGGRFEYDLSLPGKPLPPIVWDHLDANMNTLPTNGGSYKFKLAVQDDPVATGKASGSFDIDALQLDVDQLQVEVTCDAGQPHPQLPPVVLKVLRRFQVAGQVTLDGSAHMPLQSLDDSSFTANINLKNGRCQPPGWTGPVSPAQCTISATDTAGLCQFKLSANDDPLASVAASGSLALKTLLLNVDQLSVSFAGDAAHLPATFPPELAEFLNKAHAGGDFHLDATGRVPLQTPEQGVYNAKLVMKEVTYQPPNWTAPLPPAHMEITCSNTGRLYRFDLAGGDTTLSSIKASGSIDLKTLLLNVDQFSVLAQCDSNQPMDQLPAQVKDPITKFKAAGQMAVDATMRMPLKQWDHAIYTGHVTVKNGRYQPNGWDGPVTPAELAFTLSNVSVPDEKSVPKVLPAVLPDQPAEAHLWLDALSAICGNQNLNVDSGEVTFNPNDLSWTIRKFHGIADVGDGPGPLKGDNTRIWIPFVAAGAGKIGDDSSSVRVALDNGAARLTPGSDKQGRILIDQINGMVTATPIGLSTSGLQAVCARGQLKASASLDWKSVGDGPPTALVYDGDAEIAGLDLHQLARQYTEDAMVRQKAFGSLTAHLKYKGSILQDSPAAGPDSVADRLVANGDVSITHGYFADIPVLKQVLIALKNSNASTVGEVGAEFDISRSVINFSRITANSPALGIAGMGTLGFDQNVSMVFVATPLADWKKDVAGTGVPILSDVGAAILGKTQDIVNGLQRALYQFRVTGKISDPKAEAALVPGLTDRMGPLFDKMVGGDKK